jgi:hypothetical protein
MHFTIIFLRIAQFMKTFSFQYLTKTANEGEEVDKICFITFRVNF